MAIYTMNKVLRKPDYFDAVVKSVTHKTPLLTILKRGAKPTDWAQEVEVEPEIGSFQMAAARRLFSTILSSAARFRMPWVRGP